ncbi:DUF1223 domain-containing protein [Thalassospira sp. MA62]|nr:DUF1223 domain-containing protein [Thalassospira sp. MA62]
MMNARPMFLALVLTLGGLAAPAQATESEIPRAVVELYTSQGCNTCPPADRVLYDLANEHQDLLLLSYHVDYWNYLGWTDPFSDPMFSERQRAYAQEMGARYVYTPQAIINGVYVIDATDKAQIRKTSLSIPVFSKMVELSTRPEATTAPASGTITLRGDHKTRRGGPKQIWLIGYDRKHERDVLSGENAGKHLIHANVVREMANLGTWDGQTKSIAFSLHTPVDGGIAVLVQFGMGGLIIGAGTLRF